MTIAAAVTLLWGILVVGISVAREVNTQALYFAAILLAAGTSLVARLAEVLA